MRTRGELRSDGRPAEVGVPMRVTHAGPHPVRVHAAGADTDTSRRTLVATMVRFLADVLGAG